MLDRALLEHLRHEGVRHCVIGGVALAAHGYARYTADVDLLTMDARVLHDDFWRGAAREVEIRVGDVLLKLEAGGPQDRNDILALAEAGEALDSFDWRDAVEKHLPHLSESARATWQRVASDLPPARR